VRFVRSFSPFRAAPREEIAARLPRRRVSCRATRTLPAWPRDSARRSRTKGARDGQPGRRGLVGATSRAGVSQRRRSSAAAWKPATSRSEDRPR